MATNDRGYDPETRPLMAETTGFQRDILRALSDIAPCNGQDVSRWVGALYDAEINHGRLYPNLDSLETDGLLSKRRHNDRSYEYRLTDDGRELLEALRDE